MWKPKQDTKQNRKRVKLIERDGDKCWICCEPFSNQPGRFPSFDHVIPKSKGGSFNLGNLRLAHSRCNYERGDKEIILTNDEYDKATKSGEHMSINAIIPALPATPVLSKVAPVASTTQDNNGNKIAINLTNNLLASSRSGSAVIANEIDVSVNGDNNNITINETNNIAIGNSSQNVTPQLNSDGTISLGSGSDAADTLIQEEIAVLITKGAQKQSDAYKKAQNIVQPVANAGTDLSA